MAQRVFRDFDELHRYIGQKLGVSRGFTIDQDMINTFADLTGDKQYIHVDSARAAAESPYPTTIAHGYLVLSLASQMCADVFQVASARTAINYGVNRVRFPAPTLVQSTLHGTVTLLQLEKIERGRKLILRLEIFAQDHDRPRCVADLVTLMYDQAH